MEDKILSDMEIIRRVRKYAESLINCKHGMCSITEAAYEERFGAVFLAILDGKYYEKYWDN